MKTEHAADKAEEWTVERIEQVSGIWAKHFPEGFKKLASAINTALTEEREAYALALQMKNIETTRANEAGQQLAAEREDHQRAGKAANEYYSEICKLRDQLAHVNDMWDRASRQADTLAEYLVDTKAELSVTQTQLAAAQAAIKDHDLCVEEGGWNCPKIKAGTECLAAAQQPLVEMLEQVFMLYPHLTEIPKLLAKVKENL